MVYFSTTWDSEEPFIAAIVAALARTPGQTQRAAGQHLCVRQHDVIYHFDLHGMAARSGDGVLLRI